ncbi:hypothetical protein QAD02_012398, partial [Eretmocerus hayati]
MMSNFMIYISDWPTVNTSRRTGINFTKKISGALSMFTMLLTFTVCRLIIILSQRIKLRRPSVDCLTKETGRIGATSCTAFAEQVPKTELISIELRAGTIRFAYNRGTLHVTQVSGARAPVDTRLSITEMLWELPHKAEQDVNP